MNHERCINKIHYAGVSNPLPNSHIISVSSPILCNCCYCSVPYLYNRFNILYDHLDY